MAREYAQDPSALVLHAVLEGVKTPVQGGIGILTSFRVRWPDAAELPPGLNAYLDAMDARPAKQRAEALNT